MLGYLTESVSCSGEKLCQRLVKEPPLLPAVAFR